MFAPLLLLLCLPAAAQIPAGSRPPFNSLKVGMTRVAVEAAPLLANARPLFSDRWGSGQSDTYRLDKHWTVTVSYDYCGAKSGKNGTAFNLRNPQNKLVSLPVFVQEDEKIR